MIDLLRIVLVVVAIVAGFIGLCCSFLMLAKQRASGRRYWLINPSAQIESWFTKECAVMLACVFIVLGAMRLRDALH
jgi:hypothetical protein